MTVDGHIDLSPDNIEKIVNDDKTFRIWVIMELVRIDDRVSKLENRWRFIEALLVAVIGSLITLIGVVIK